MKSKILFCDREMIIEEKNKGICLIKYLYLFFFIFLGNGCSDTKQLADSNINVIDINRIQPEKILHAGDEVVSVEFIPLETNDEFLCGGKVVAFTDEIIVYHNFNFKGGDILLFDRKGKALKKISRQGPGGEEYASSNSLVYDDANKELYVNSILSGKIVIYDLEGNFKRCFRQNPAIFWDIENYDNESLICYTRDENIEHPFFLISKQTGEKIRDIVIPYEKKIYPDIQWQEGHVGVRWKSLIKTGEEFIIFEPSSDTIYRLNPKESVLRPVLYRTPPIQTMNPPVFLVPNMKINSFLFITCLKKEYSFEKRQGFPADTYVYDCRDGKFYTIISFPDIVGGNHIDVIHDKRSNVFLVEFPATNWSEQGKLEKGLTGLKDDDNPVLIIVTLKE
jgi:hypothetical protein